MKKTCKTIQEKIKINFLYLILGFVILNFTNCDKKVTTTTSDYRDQYVGNWRILYTPIFTGTGPLSYDSFKSDIIKYVGTDNFLGTFPYNNTFIFDACCGKDYIFTKLENDTKGMVITSSDGKDTLYVNPDKTVELTNATKRKLLNFTRDYDSTINQYTTKNYDLVLDDKSIYYNIEFKSSSHLTLLNTRTLRLKSTMKNINKTFPFSVIISYVK